MNKLNKEKGITLIALVVTIIVLIILAAVSINLVLGENGIISKAIEAKTKSEDEKIKEEISFDILEYKMSDNAKITNRELEQILNQYGEIIYEEDNQGIKSIKKDEREIDISDILNNINIQKDIYMNDSVLYCWDWEQTLQEHRYSIKEMCRELKITSVYLCFDPLNWTDKIEDTKTFIKEMNTLGISVLALNGDPSWAYNANVVKQVLIDNVVKYNKNAQEDEKIIGVVLDIEPAGTSKWQENELEALKEYVKTQKEIYNYTKQQDLMVIQCIPYWFDDVGLEQLEDLIKNACHGISVMNYWKDSTVELIRNEMQFAKKYNKYIDSICEFGKPNGDVTDSITFYNDGIEAAKENWKQIDEEYNYFKLGMAYHDYGAINEIQGKVYTIEIYLNENDQKLANTNIKVVNVNRENVDIIESKTTEGGYAVFWLNYGKTYRVEVEGYGIAGLTPDFKTKEFSFLEKEGNYFAIDAYVGEASATKYNAEIYFKNESSELITNKNVKIVNVNNSSEEYNGTITSGGYISTWLKHGEEYQISVDGYTVKNPIVKYNEDIGTYIAFDIICN